MHKHKNYFAIILAFGMFATTTSLVSLNAHAWNGQHHGQGTYHHAVMHGAYVTSAPQHLHRHADPDCPYYNSTSSQNSQPSTLSQPSSPNDGQTSSSSSTSVDTTSYGSSTSANTAADYNNYGHGSGHHAAHGRRQGSGNGNGNGHHRNAAHADCPYYSAN